MKKIFFVFIAAFVLFGVTAQAEKIQYKNDEFSLTCSFSDGWKVVDSRVIEIAEPKVRIARVMAMPEDRSKAIIITANRKDKLEGNQDDFSSDKVRSLVEGYKSSRPNALFQGSEVREINGIKGTWVTILDEMGNKKRMYNRMFLFSVRENEYNISYMTQNQEQSEAEFYIKEIMNDMQFQ